MIIPHSYLEVLKVRAKLNDMHLGQTFCFSRRTWALWIPSWLCLAVLGVGFMECVSALFYSLWCVIFSFHGSVGVAQLVSGFLSLRIVPGSSCISKAPCAAVDSVCRGRKWFQETPRSPSCTGTFFTPGDGEPNVRSDFRSRRACPIYLSPHLDHLLTYLHGLFKYFIISQYVLCLFF